MHFVGGGIRGNWGIFAQMYEKMIQEHNFHVQYVIAKMGMKLAQI